MFEKRENYNCEVVFEFCEKLILDFKGGLKVFKGVIRERRINIRVFLLSFSGNK